MNSVALYAAIAVIVVLVAILVVVGLVRGRGKAPQPPLSAAVRHSGEGSPVAAPPTRAVERTPRRPSMMAQTWRFWSGRKPLLVASRDCGRGWRVRTSWGRAACTAVARRPPGDTWDAIEETLLTSDLGVGPTTELMNQLRTEVKIQGNTDPATVKNYLRNDLLGLVDPTLDRSLATQRNVGLDVPAVVMVVGVNGTGKTTTSGKLARLLVADDEDVVLGAADTFRAAAAEQLVNVGSVLVSPW